MLATEKGMQATMKEKCNKKSSNQQGNHKEVIDIIEKNEDTSVKSQNDPSTSSSYIQGEILSSKSSHVESDSYNTRKNDAITITRKENDTITIPQNYNEHISITCNKNGGIKTKCKRKKSRGGKRVQRRKRNQAKSKEHNAPSKNVISQCDACKQIMQSKPLLKVAKTNNTSQFNVLDLKNMKISTDCLATNVQQQRETMINTKLMEIIQSTINTVSFTWSFKK